MNSAQDTVGRRVHAGKVGRRRWRVLVGKQVCARLLWISDAAPDEQFRRQPAAMGEIDQLLRRHHRQRIHPPALGQFIHALLLQRVITAR